MPDALRPAVESIDERLDKLIEQPFRAGFTCAAASARSFSDVEQRPFAATPKG